MVTQRIPPQYRRGLESIRALRDEDAEELLLALENVPPIIDRDALLSTTVDRISNIPRSVVEEAVSALFSLYALRARQGSTALDVAGDISRAMESGDYGESEDYEGLLAREDIRNRFKDRLAKLLDVDSLYLVGKANDLRFENEHVLLDARVLTDPRPIFGADPERSPEAAVIVHTLRISYLDADNRYKDFHIALDTRDVRGLTDQLNRARSKAGTLKSFLESVDVSYLDVE